MTPAQTKLRQLRERQSKERGRLAELAIAEDLTDETRAELDAIETGTPDLERQLRAATVAVEAEETEQRASAMDGDAGAAGDSETRERTELRSKASLTEFLVARAQGRVVTGAEAELQAAAGVQGIPLELWDVPTRAEQRAATEAPGTVGVNLDAIRPAVFANSIAPRLGIEMPRVMSGTYASATIADSTTAAARTKGADATATAATFTVTSVTPKSISARLSLQIEDIAAVGQANFESILRENLSLKLSDALDDQVINGDGVTPNLTGILARLSAPSAPGAAVAVFDDFVGRFADGIDGLWASTMSEVSVVCGPDTYKVAAKAFRDRVIDTGNRGGVSLGDISFADYAMAKFGGFWTNKRMPDTDSNIQAAILYRRGRNMAGGAGAMRTAVCPHWNEVSIDDIYSGSASGTRHFTIHVLLGDVILVQPSAYAETSFRVSV